MAQQQFHRKVNSVLKMINDKGNACKICDKFCKLVDYVKNSSILLKIKKEEQKRIDEFIKAKINESLVDETNSTKQHDNISEYLDTWHNLDEKMQQYVRIFIIKHYLTFFLNIYIEHQIINKTQSGL